MTPVQFGITDSLKCYRMSFDDVTKAVHSVISFIEMIFFRLEMKWSFRIFYKNTPFPDTLYTPTPHTAVIYRVGRKKRSELWSHIAVELHCGESSNLDGLMSQHISTSVWSCIHARLWDRDILQFKDSTAELGFLPASSHTRLCVFICNRDSTRFIACNSFNEVNQLINKLTEENMTRQTQKWVSLS